MCHRVMRNVGSGQTEFRFTNGSFSLCFKAPTSSRTILHRSVRGSWHRANRSIAANMSGLTWRVLIGVRAEQVPPGNVNLVGWPHPPSGTTISFHNCAMRLRRSSFTPANPWTVTRGGGRVTATLWAATVIRCIHTVPLSVALPSISANGREEYFSLRPTAIIRRLTGIFRCRISAYGAMHAPN